MIDKFLCFLRLHKWLRRADRLGIACMRPGCEARYDRGTSAR